MRVCLYVLLFGVCVTWGSVCAFGIDKPFPSQVLTANTIVVVSNYGVMSTALNLSKGTEFKNEAEAVIRSSHRLTALSDTVLTERTD